MTARNVTLEQLHAMTRAQRRLWYSRATAEQCEGLFVPCTGEAHDNALIDHCGKCLLYSWGIMLAPLSEPKFDTWPHRAALVDTALDLCNVVKRVCPEAIHECADAMANVTSSMRNLMAVLNHHDGK